MCQFCGQAHSYRGSPLGGRNLQGGERHHRRMICSRPIAANATCYCNHVSAIHTARQRPLAVSKQIFQEAIDRCFSGITVDGVSPTHHALQRRNRPTTPHQVSRRRKSPASAAPTEPPQTTPGSGNSKPLDPSGLTTPANACHTRHRPSVATIETGARKLKQGPQVREGRDSYRHRVSL